MACVWGNQQDDQEFIINYILSKIMSEFDSIDHLDIGRYQQSYFANPKQDDDNHNSKKRTGIIDQFSDSLNMPFQFPQNPISQQKNSPSQQNYPIAVGSRRPKKIIEVGQKKRSNYLKTKNGSSYETNDLSTYVCSIIKSLCDDYMLCELAKEQEKQIIEQFKKSKPNINSIQILLREKGEEKSGSGVQEKGWKREKRELVEYLSMEMGRTQVLKQRVLMSRKMKFSNKLRMIKYMQKIRKSVSNAEQFEGWKKQHF